MNRTTARLLSLLALTAVAALSACSQSKDTSSSQPMAQEKGWGAAPYTEWKPITPPSQTPAKK